MTDDEKQRLAETVRAACLDAATKSYGQASISGLCGEGAWEAARGAIQALDLKRLLEKSGKETS